MPYYVLYTRDYDSPCIGFMKCEDIIYFLDKLNLLEYLNMCEVEKDNFGFYSKNTENFYIKLKKEEEYES